MSELATASQGPWNTERVGLQDAGRDFKWLDADRQALVFQTIQDGLTSDPPRPDATFERVVEAYLTLTKVIKDAASGALTDSGLAQLQEDIQSAGGYLAPGLAATGDQSLAAFRKATFGMLERTLKPRVVSAVIDSLNCYLQKEDLCDIGELFQAIARFLSPLGKGSNDDVWNEFTAFDSTTQEFVFKTIADGLRNYPVRQGATFHNVVYAYSVERLLISEASSGNLGPDVVIALQAAIAEAGGYLSSGLSATGQSSVQELRSSTFDLIEKDYPTEVFDAALFYLNGRLKNTHYQNAAELFAAVQAAWAPVIIKDWEPPSLKAFKAFTSTQQGRIFRTMHHAVEVDPSLESNIFDLVVSCYSAEQAIVDSSRRGQLNVELLRQFRQSLSECGGYIEPNTYLAGQNSIQQCLDSSIAPIQHFFPAQVVESMFRALNSKLACSTIDSVSDVIVVINDFTKGLRASISDSSVQPTKSFQDDHNLISLNSQADSSPTPIASELHGGSAMALPMSLLNGQDVGSIDLTDTITQKSSISPSVDGDTGTMDASSSSSHDLALSSENGDTQQDSRTEELHDTSVSEEPSRLIAIQDVSLSLKPSVNSIQLDATSIAGEGSSVGRPDDQQLSPSREASPSEASRTGQGRAEPPILQPPHGNFVNDPLTNYSASQGSGSN